MADLIEQGSSWLQGQRKKHLTRTVTYKRGVDNFEIKATVGQTMFRIDDDIGTSTVWHSRDYLIDVPDLVIGSVNTRPQSGDCIIDQIGDMIVTYEVMGPPNGEPAWRWSDRNQTVFRIHTKAISEQ